MASGIRDKTSARAKHERGGDNEPICGEGSENMVATPEVNCRECLTRMQGMLATELVRNIGKLAKPTCGPKDRITLHIHIERDGDPDINGVDRKPDIIIPNRF